jgi:hypothetical protein
VNAAWIGVIGALGGVVLGATVNLVADHFRWQREEARLEQDRLRAMHERRRELSVVLASTVDELSSRAWTLADYRAETPKGWRADPYVQLLADKIDAVLAAVNRSYNELRILGIGDELTDAADRLLELSVEAVNSTFADELGEWDVEALSVAGGDFLDAAHDEFGVTRRIQRPGRPSAAGGQVLVRPRR